MEGDVLLEQQAFTIVELLSRDKKKRGVSSGPLPKDTPLPDDCIAA
jgi:hypothetical protein